MPRATCGQGSAVDETTRRAADWLNGWVLGLAVPVVSAFGAVWQGGRSRARVWRCEITSSRGCALGAGREKSDCGLRKAARRCCCGGKGADALPILLYSSSRCYLWFVAVKASYSCSQSPPLQSTLMCRVARSARPLPILVAHNAQGQRGKSSHTSCSKCPRPLDSCSDYGPSHSVHPDHPLAVLHMLRCHQ